MLKFKKFYVLYFFKLSDQNYSENLLSISILSTDELTKFQEWLKMMYDQKKEIQNENFFGELKLSTALNVRTNNMSTLSAQKLLNKLVELNWIVVVINIFLYIFINFIGQ